MMVSGGCELNLAELNVPQLLNDKSADAALKLHHYYKWVKEDNKSADKWQKEYHSRKELNEH
jgi:hypothetical protein